MAPASPKGVSIFSPSVVEKFSFHASELLAYSSVKLAAMKGSLSFNPL
jgi:hypothetical protein